MECPYCGNAPEHYLGCAGVTLATALADLLLVDLSYAWEVVLELRLMPETYLHMPIKLPFPPVFIDGVRQVELPFLIKGDYAFCAFGNRLYIAERETDVLG